ncbi:MAG: hypothetical protein JKX97_07440 [Candidatus Lindowbacteria bacterium]|nr:hypothetical protein [Candidatus Lindowbacteria bacterium]
MKKFAILALAVALAVPASAAGVTISGYVDVGFIAAESDFGGEGLQASGATNGTWNGNDGFTLNEVNLDIASQLTNDISSFVSIDFNSRTDITARPSTGVDYAYLDIANPGPFDLNIRAGRIPSVFGIEQRASESNQTNFINMSLLSPLTVGSLDGIAVYGSFSPVNYALAISNNDVASGRTANVAGDAGSILGEYSTALLGNPLRNGAPGNNNGSALASGLDNNNDVSISGRLGVVPVEGLEVGVSYSLNDFASGGTANAGATRKLIAVDASYAYGPFGLKAEWVRGDEEPTVAAGVSATGQENVDLRGFYVEGTYDISSKYSAGVRYNAVQTSQNGIGGPTAAIANDFRTIAISGIYRMADNVVLKAEYDINSEGEIQGGTVNRVAGGSAVKDIDNDVFAMSLVGSF